jgi:Tfp pilus assembly protein PilF
MIGDSETLFAELARVPTRRAVRSFVRRHGELRDAATVDRLHDEVVRVALSDVRQADRLAKTARHVAELLGEARARAQGLRAAGHVRFARGQYVEALDDYEAALKIFRRLGGGLDVARTALGALQTFVLLGYYDRAYKAAEEARQIFDQHGDRLRVARLDSNLGNVLARQNRFEEALACYQSAYAELSVRGEPRDVAAVLLNIAVCCISLNDFEQARATYDRARSYCEEHGMPLLVVQADYNIAYLHYLRGEYSKALAMYNAVQAECDATGDEYHRALCDLDRSELYLELNLTDEGGELAERALARFTSLGTQYEAAKALTNVALAAGHDGNTARALELFTRARRLFGAERNVVRQALVDLYRAVILRRAGRTAQSARSCERAAAIFGRSGLPIKAAYCELLLARLAIGGGAPARASGHVTAALDLLKRADAPALVQQAHFLRGLIAEAHGDARGARRSFQRAHARLEQLRGHVHGDDLKIAFLKDKVEIYEALVATCLARTPSQSDIDAAFGYMEQAKSRSLADLMAFRATSLAPRSRPDIREDVARLRQELNWYSRRIAAEELQRGQDTADRLDTWRRRARALETRLQRTLSALRANDEEFASLQGGGTCGLEELRSALPADAVLLEYYQARGRLYAAVLDRERLNIVPLGSVGQVRGLLRLLQFQLSKFRLGSSYTEAFAGPMRAATESHLAELYAALITPLRPLLTRNHVVVVPHDFLHYVPFHALTDGTRSLIDDFTMSYAPSANVYRLCRMKAPVAHERSLVMGIADAATPSIPEEIAAVAAAVPSPDVLVGSEATHDRLRALAPESRFIHIATHGVFRADNPMFSSILLGDGPLNLFDLYHLDLSAELVTLSGCSTGMNAVIGGDELVGLVRGLLYSGARSVMLTLWDAHDCSTAMFMKAFYSGLNASGGQSAAFRQAMRQVRDEYPHPFYWAPFILVGG